VTTKQQAIAEAARWLNRAADGHERKYGSVPLDTRLELADRWTALARVIESD
jgi:hypothetical protein